LEISEARPIIKTLTRAYPDKQIPPATIEVYVRCLADLPREVVEGAVLSHISSNKWFPTIAELRTAALDFIPGGRMPTALEAWAEVMRAFSEVGYYRQPTFSHPAIEQAVTAMGWRDLCMSENGMADRAHFIRLYETYCNRLKADLVQLAEVRDLRERLGEAPLLEVEHKVKLLSDRKRVKEPYQQERYNAKS